MKLQKSSCYHVQKTNKIPCFHGFSMFFLVFPIVDVRWPAQRPQAEVWLQQVWLRARRSPKVRLTQRRLLGDSHSWFEGFTINKILRKWEILRTFLGFSICGEWSSQLINMFERGGSTTNQIGFHHQRCKGIVTITIKNISMNGLLVGGLGAIFYFPIYWE